MWSDFRYAVRQLRKSPGFTLTAALTLALGIGANTAIFTLIDSILLRPLPFPQQQQLMRIGYGGTESDASFFPKGWVRALGEHSASFAAVSGFGADAESNVGDAGSSARIFGATVMANALDTLDVPPALGRFFSAEDARAGHDPVVVLSYGYWREHFAANADAIGQTLRIDGVSRRVIGVMPAGTRFPYADTQFLTPVTFKGGDATDPWQDFDLRAFGRLRAGVTPSAAQAEIRRLQPLLLPLFPWRMPDIWARNMTVVPLLESEVGATRPRLLLLFGAVGLILLIACANVANLMLARAAGREREIAVRSALGATGSRLVRQLLAESIVLGAVAGIVGLIVAATSLQALVTLLPADTPRISNVSLHWPVFLFAAAASVVTGVLFGLIPALRMASPNLHESLHAGSRSVAGKAGQFRVSMMLVMGQIALSVVVITAAGLMLRSLWSLSDVNPGFQTSRIVTAEVSLDANACSHGDSTAPSATGSAPSAGRCQAFFTSLLDRARGIVGEENVALTDSLPLSGRFNKYVYDAQGHPREARQGALMATGRTVSPGYFATLGMHLVRGRLLDAQDGSGASRAAVISESMAERLWPKDNPIGQHLMNVDDEATPAVWNMQAAATVVGVVSNTHEGSLAGAVGDEVYLPMTATDEQPTMYALLRTRASTREAADALRNTVAQMDPLVPVTRVRTLNEVVAASESAPRSLTVLLLVFGGLAVVIGGVGVYSLIAYVVSWRTREIGIRLALGAQRWQIVHGVVRQSLVLAAGGSAIGLVGAAAVAQLMRGFLFEVKAVDPITFAAVTVLMLLLALAAAWIPARRAAGVDPIKTLRME
ncbi:MAG TPA: ABC transporter permease [Acidobacteriaceae bacterium]|jgi:predicted permease|nr:ABC transporter permease [Acidobacteriaceae bacterium]